MMPAGCRPAGGRVVARAAAKALEQEAVRALDATTFKDDAEFPPNARNASITINHIPQLACQAVAH
jgi:hypothetical protein